MAYTKKDKHRKITVEEFNDALKLLIDTGGKDIDSFSEEETKKMLEEQFLIPLRKAEEENIQNLSFDNSKSEEQPVNTREMFNKRFNYDWNIKYFLNQQQITDLDKSFELLCKDFEKDIRKLTGFEINCSVPKLNINFTKNEIDNAVNYEFTYDYEKIIMVDNNKPLYLYVTPRLANNVLVDSYRDDIASKIKKEIVNNFIYRPLIAEINKYAKTDAFRNQMEVENHKSEIDEDKMAYCYFEIKVSYKGLHGSIMIMASEDLWSLFVGKAAKNNENKLDFKNKNAYAILAETNMADEEIKNLYVGEEFVIQDLIIDSDNFGFSNASYILDGNKVASASVVFISRHYGIEIKSVTDCENCENQNYMENSENNLFIILGSNFVSDENRNKIQNDYLIELDREMGDDFPVVYNNKVVALCNYNTEGKVAVLKITEVFDKPVDFIECSGK